MVSWKETRTAVMTNSLFDYQFTNKIANHFVKRHREFCSNGVRHPRQANAFITC